jgi:hypothetical protein
MIVLARGAALLPTSDKHPERDLVNFPRPKRLIDPEPVRHTCIPERWFEFFYPRLGVTGMLFFFHNKYLPRRKKNAVVWTCSKKRGKLCRKES